MQVFDPSRAYNAFTAGAQLGGAMRQRETERMAAPAISAGNYGQAAEIYGQRGDVAGAAGYRQMYEQQLAQMDEQQKAQALERNNTLARAAMSVRQVPYEQRKQVLMQQAPVLSQMGIDTEMLAQFDPTDEAIDGIMFQIMELDQLLKAQAPVTLSPGAALYTPGGEMLAQNVKPEGEFPSATDAMGVRRYTAGPNIGQPVPGFETPRQPAPQPSIGLQFGEGGTLTGLTYGSGPAGKSPAIVQGPEGEPRVSPAPQQTALNQALRNLEEFEAQNLIVMDDISRAMENIDNWSAGAMAWTKDIPVVGGITPAGQLESFLTTLEANVGFDKLQAMREASPTGGALGAVTERELAFLQAVFGSMRQDQRPENLKYNLERLRRHMAGRNERLRAAFERDFPTLTQTSQFRTQANQQIQQLTVEEQAELEALRAELGMQ